METRLPDHPLSAPFPIDHRPMALDPQEPTGPADVLQQAPSPSAPSARLAGHPSFLPRQRARPTSANVPFQDGRRRDWLLLVISVTCAAAATFLVATRDLDVGRDTHRYASFYYSLDARFLESRFEPGFLALSRALRTAGFSLQFYFGLLFVLLITLHLAATLHIARALKLNVSRQILSAVALGVLFAWPFFPSAAVNGIRQGLSAPLTLISIIFVYQRRWLAYAISTLLAISFHFTAVLFAPFALLVLNRHLPPLAVLLGSILYATGVSEDLVFLLSPKLHQIVIEYGSDADYQTGVRFDFLLFSLSLYLVFRLAHLLLPTPWRRSLQILANCYLVCLIPFLLLGWGAFSNRFLLPAWLTSAVLPTFLLSAVKIRQISPRTIARLAPLAGAGVFIGTTFF